MKKSYTALCLAVALVAATLLCAASVESHPILPLAGVGAAALLAGFWTVRAFRRARIAAAENERLRTAAEQSAIGLAIIDREGRFTFANRSLAELIGVNRGAIVGMEASLRRGSWENKAIFDEAERAGREGKSWSGTVRILRPPGRPPAEQQAIDVFIVTSPICENGGVTGHVVSCRDVTEEVAVRRQLEETARVLTERTAELQRATESMARDLDAKTAMEQEKAKLERQLRRSRTLEAVGQLAGGVAHDYNNLLGSMLACLYTVQREIPPDSPGAEEVERIKELCRRGGELTRQLLALGRRTPGQMGAFGVNDLMESVEILLRRTLPRGITIRIEVPAGLPRVRGDRTHLLTALLNVALNARDAMPDGGDLSIRCGRAEDEGGAWVVIEVADTGCGIPESIQERIFEPFFTTKKPGLGTGLGLSTAVAAVTECGGDIAVRSRPGEGATFTLRIPALAGELAGGHPRAEPGAHPFTSGYVLIVEDDEVSRSTLVGLMASLGYHTIAVATGLEALEAVRDNREAVGAVTLDVVLTEMSGIEVHRYLRQFAPEIPILFITGRTELLAPITPAPPSLAKPFTRAELGAAMASLLETPAAKG
jgi:PAS domain S-box-containing protein